jgi:hypothetical protein
MVDAEALAHAGQVVAPETGIGPLVRAQDQAQPVNLQKLLQFLARASVSLMLSAHVLMHNRWPLR